MGSRPGEEETRGITGPGTFLGFQLIINSRGNRVGGSFFVPVFLRFRRNSVTNCLRASLLRRHRPFFAPFSFSPDSLRRLPPLPSVSISVAPNYYVVIWSSRDLASFFSSVLFVGVLANLSFYELISEIESSMETCFFFYLTMLTLQY